MNEITSRDNQNLKFAKAVRDGRERERVFIEGTRLVEEALRATCLIGDCFVTRAFLDTDRGKGVAEQLAKAETKVSLVSDSLLRSIADTENPQGIVALAERPADGMRTLTERLADAEMKLVVMLHQINNPSNLGAVVRTAEAAGVVGVITTAGSADAYSPKSLRASMGSAFRLPVWENADLDKALEWADGRLTTTALDLSGNSSIYLADWKIPRLLIAGSEAHGLEKTLLTRISDVLRIPMEPAVESLNLAVSCGITLFEARRQQQR